MTFVQYFLYDLSSTYSDCFQRSIPCVMPEWRIKRGELYVKGAGNNDEGTCFLASQVKRRFGIYGVLKEAVCIPSRMCAEPFVPGLWILQ